MVAAEIRQLQRAGVEHVCVSLDGEAALLLGPENSYYASAPGTVSQPGTELFSSDLIDK